MKLALVPATPADLERILPLMQDFYAEEELEFRPARARAALTELLDAPSLGGVYFLDAGREGPVGYIVVTVLFSLEFGGRCLFADELFVLRAHRRKGSAQAAVRALAELAPSLGAHAVRAEVEESNAPIRALVTKVGFQIHSRHMITLRVSSK